MCSSHQDLKYSVKVRLNIKELLPLFVCGDIVRFFFFVPLGHEESFFGYFDIDDMRKDIHCCCL